VTTTAPAAAPATMVSADSHLIEPPDLYRSLVAEWGDRAPVVRRDADGTDWWWVDGQRTNSFAGGSQTGRRFDDPDSLVLADAVDNVRAEVWTPDRYVADNLTDGVIASVLYPTQQLQHYAVRNTPLLSATCRVYNDWVAEFSGAHPQRLAGLACLNVDDPAEAAAELERAVTRGLRGGFIPVGLPHRQTYADPRFDVLWSAAETLDVPLSLHIGTYRASPARDKAVVIAGAQTDTPKPVQTAFSTADLYVRSAIADLVFAGVLERHPRLRLVSAEHEVGWFAHFVERMDYTYTQRATKGHRFADATLPGDFVRRQVFVQFCEDPLAALMVQALGEHNLFWGGDYPHSEGTFPHSRTLVERILAPLTAAQRRAVLVDNAVRVYGLDLPDAP
jgi:predicted TIM-barrel fold metal-dependent hydrolase